MAEIIQPDAFNARFTIYLNTEGKPVQRTLREMTADEVIAAVQWSTAETDRLNREAEPARAFAVALEEGRREALADMTREGMEAASASLRAAQAATDQHIRLLKLIQIAMPQWRRHSAAGLRDALHRHWPSGRAA